MDKAIAKNIRQTITRLRGDQVVGMSLENLFAVTPTTGVSCPRAAYPRLFREAALAIADKRQFPLSINDPDRWTY